MAAPPDGDAPRASGAPRGPAPRSAAGTPWEIVAAAVVLLVAAAGAGGAVAGARARPSSTAAPTLPPETLPPTPTPVDPAEVERRAFAQPLAAGCATDRAVWLFADGGSAIRFDGRLWTIPDETLRSLSAAICRQGAATAVGDGGSIVTIDEDRRSVRVDRTGSDDLHAIAPLSDGALAVGSRGTILSDGALAVGSGGTILRQSAVDWTRVDGGMTADLFGVAVSGTTAWVVGDSGVAYRLSGSTWSTVPTGTQATLRAVVVPSPGTAVAAGDGGALLRWTGGAWDAVASGTTGSLRSAAVIGPATWVVGDGGTVIELLGGTVRHVDLRTTCTLRAVFPESASVWLVGSDALRGGAWRITPGGTDRWGTC